MSNTGFCVEIDASKLRLGVRRARGSYHVPLRSACPDRLGAQRAQGSHQAPRRSVRPDRTAELEERADRERALRAQAELRAEKLSDEACRLRKRLQRTRAACSSALQDKRKLLRRLLLEFHPDKSGRDAVFTSTALSQKILELMHEQG